MWHLGYGHRTLREPMLTHNGHTLYMFGADARCSVSFDHPSGCSCVGASMHQAICRECRWHAITTDDSEAVAAWHDHAMPGWRELPTMSIKNPRDGAGRPTPQAIAWIEANYPAEWIFPGAPTIRPLEQYGNRAVEGRSPLGGFDFAL